MKYLALRDVVSINYQVDDYDRIRAACPNKPIISTEDDSQVMTGGAYVTDRPKNVLTAYDDIIQGWPADNRIALEVIAKRPSFGGGFIWTGVDYRGEPTPFNWPSVSSCVGGLDPCGFPKTAFYTRQAFWIHDQSVPTRAPHWNWTGKEGQPVNVMALANADTGALSLNGELAEEKPVDKFRKRTN